MCTWMRLAGAADLTTTVLHETLRVDLVPACPNHMQRLALFLAIGFVIAELDAALHVIVRGVGRFVARARAGARGSGSGSFEIAMFAAP